MKKIMSVMLAMTLIVGLVSTTKYEVYAKENYDTVQITSNDVFEDHLVETLEIDGTSYTYQYSIDKNGNRTVEVINNKTTEVETLTCDSSDNTLYLNEQSVGSINSSLDIEEDNESFANIVPNNRRSAKGAFVYWGKLNEKVTLKKTMSVAAAAAVIALVLPCISAKLVVLAMGSAVLSTLIGIAGPGTVKGNIYRLNSVTKTQFKYVWTYTTKSGEKFGSYTIFSAIQ